MIIIILNNNIYKIINIWVIKYFEQKKKSLTINNYKYILFKKLYIQNKHTHTHIYTHIHTHIHINTHIHIYTHIHIHTIIHTNIYA